MLPHKLFSNIPKAMAGKITTAMDLKRSKVHFKLFQQFAETLGNRE